MKYSLLIVVSLVLFIVPAARSQQQSPGSTSSAGSTVSSDAPAKPAAKLTPTQVTELRADVLMAEKEYADAIHTYDSIVRANPKNAQVLDKMGVAYQQLLNLREAEKYYKKSAKADKTFASPVNNIGTVEYEKKHYKNAIKYYKKALKIRPDMATVYTNLGYAYFERKDYPNAIGSFRQALLIDPNIFENRGEGGAMVQQRMSTDPGLFYFYVAKSYAMAGDAAHAAHFLKLSRDDGYQKFASAAKDPAFAKVIKDPRVQQVLTVTPVYATDQKKTVRD
ncbi:MAG TPA: tetratricopeptide repeat protein [Candidatus Acidoferrales bacterium]|nr:tetratricopeptide repeat protein [Candidatus Acidoferrales bacterium]